MKERLVRFSHRNLNPFGVAKFHTPKPLYFAIAVTRRCISRCVMCSSWKATPGREPTYHDVRHIFSNPVLDQLEGVNFIGGEPTLRKDLARLARGILEVNPNIKQLGMITNGLETESVERRLHEIFSLPMISDLRQMAVSVSLDGYGETHDKIRRVPNAFKRVDKTIRSLLKLRDTYPFSVNLICTIQKINIGGLDRLKDYARNLGLHVFYNPVAHLSISSEVFEEKVKPTVAQLAELKDFIFNRANVSRYDRAFWNDYFKLMKGKKRTFPCAAPYYFLKMKPEGNLYMCGNGDHGVYGNVFEREIDKIWYSARAQEIRSLQKKDYCGSCNIANKPEISLRSHPAHFAAFLLREKFLFHFSSLSNRLKRYSPTSR